jgi:hypothetical protein
MEQMPQGRKLAGDLLGQASCEPERVTFSAAKKVVQGTM